MSIETWVSYGGLHLGSVFFYSMGDTQRRLLRKSALELTSARPLPIALQGSVYGRAEVSNFTDPINKIARCSAVKSDPLLLGIECLSNTENKVVGTLFCF